MNGYEIGYANGNPPPNDFTTFLTVGCPKQVDIKADEVPRFTFRQTLETDGIKIGAVELQPDPPGNFLFQLSKVRAGFSHWSFDDPLEKVRQSPNATFFLGDEPDRYAGPPDVYAEAYIKFVDSVKAGSQTAKVSPGGFVLYNAVYEDWWRDEFAKLIGGTQVDEWRFQGGLDCNSKESYKFFEERLRKCVEWAANRGKNTVLGSFGYSAVDDQIDMTGYLKDAMAMIKLENRILEAVYWRYNIYPPTDKETYRHELVDRSGNLTRDGRIFVEMM